jgi:transmembrane sensor
MNASHSAADSDDDAIETAAACWLIEREDGFTPDRARQFAAWRAADPRHEAALACTEGALDLLAELPAMRAPLEERLAAESKIVRPLFFRLPMWGAGLAAVFAVAAGIWWVGPWRGAAVQRYATAPTRQQRIALVDGSMVNLNVSTEVRVALTRESRRVTLTAGEAHFAVAHDTARPFIVTAAGVSVRAVGTAFSIRLGESDVAVLVTEGKVEITRDIKGAAPIAVLPVEHPLLVAGERTRIARDVASAATTIEPVSTIALESAERWHSNVMTFTDLPLRDAVALFNRRNDQQLVLADAALGERKIGGTFAADQVEALVRLLMQDGDVAVERRDAGQIVLRRAP